MDRLLPNSPDSNHTNVRQRLSVAHYITEAAANCSVFRCAWKVVMVAELLVTGYREFQTAGAVILNALDWKLILVAS